MRLLAVIAFGLAATTTASAQAVDNARLLADGRASHYSLQRQGFQGMVCALAPDWTALVGKRGSPEAGDAYKVIDALKFAAKVDAGGRVVMDFHAEGDAGSRPGVAQIVGGMDQTIHGFFATWSGFMVGSPWPEPGTAATVTPQAGGRRVAYREQDGSAVTLDLDQNDRVTRVDVRTPDFHSLIAPRFQSTAQGLVMTSYVADFAPTHGSGMTHLVVNITYQTVSATQVPSVIDVDSTYDGEPSKVKLFLTGCRAGAK